MMRRPLDPWDRFVLMMGLPLVAVIIGSMVVFLLGHRDAATLISYGGTVLVLLANVVYIVIRERRGRYACRRCKDTGLITVKKRVPRADLHPALVAEEIVLGGYHYNEVVIECDHSPDGPRNGVLIP